MSEHDTSKEEEIVSDPSNDTPRRAEGEEEGSTDDVTPVEHPPPDPTPTHTPLVNVMVQRNISNPMMSTTTHFESDAASRHDEEEVPMEEEEERERHEEEGGGEHTDMTEEHDDDDYEQPDLLRQFSRASAETAVDAATEPPSDPTMPSTSPPSIPSSPTDDDVEMSSVSPVKTVGPSVELDISLPIDNGEMDMEIEEELSPPPPKRPISPSPPAGPMLMITYPMPPAVVPALLPASTLFTQPMRKETSPEPSSGDKSKRASSLSSIRNMSELIESTLRRVKVYVLNAERNWDDRGTGHVIFDEKRPALTVKAEADDDEERKTLLDSEILMSTGYQKQQDTLIVWSESDTCDLALSFQEKNGCDKIWRQICSVQGKDASNNNTSENDSFGGDEDGEESEMSSVSQNMLNMSAGAVALPACEIGRVVEINELLSGNMHLASKREMLANAIEQHDYIAKLLVLFAQLEESADDKHLRVMYLIFKNLFMLNKNALLDVLLSEANIRQVVGALEYEPASEDNPKRNHRVYLWHEAHFKEVCPITNGQLQQKIHQAYRANYIQEVILPAPSILEENLLSALNSFIFFTRVDIVTAIIDDYDMLRDFFTKLTADETSVTERNDCTMFLKELCTFAQTLQAHGPQSNKEQFFKTLSSLGVLAALKKCLASTCYSTRAAAMEIMAMLVDHNALMAREYMLGEASPEVNNENESKLLINLLVTQLWNDEDPELACGHQLITVLRFLADPENVISSITNRTEKAEFLSFFYKHSMHYLVAPLMSNTASGKIVRDDYAFANAQTALCDYLMFCCEHHAVHARTLLANKKVLERVLVLLQSKHSFLKLTALRLFRRVVGLKDGVFNRHIVNERLFAPIFEAYSANGHRYNLMNSALLELIEFVRAEGIRDLIIHIGELYLPQFQSVSYVNTFQQLKVKYDQLTDSSSAIVDLPYTTQGTLVRAVIFEKGGLADDFDKDWVEDEDTWEKEESNTSLSTTPTVEENDEYAANLPSVAKAEEDDEIFTPIVPTPAAPHRSITIRTLSTLSKQNAIDDATHDGITTPPVIGEHSKTPPLTPTPSVVTSTVAMRGLVAYDDSSSDEEEEEKSDESPGHVSSTTCESGVATPSTEAEQPSAKRARLTTEDEGSDKAAGTPPP